MSLSFAPTVAFRRAVLATPSAPVFTPAAIDPQRIAALAASPDRKVLGMACIVAGAISFPLSDLAAQSLMSAMPPIEVAWLRYCVFFLIAAPLVLLRGRAAVRTARPGVQILRGVMTATSTMAALLSFKVLPVPEATAIGFVCPVFVTALAVVVLKESVGLRRWAAALAALVGVLVIVRPGASSFQMAALLPLAGAVASAVAVIATRLIKADDVGTTILYTAGVGTAVLTVAAAPVAVMPQGSHLAILLVVGVFGGLGTVLQIVGYRLAAASLLAPFSYLQLVCASGLGFLLLGTVPQATTVVGAAIIAGSALYTAARERVRGVA